MLRVHWLLIGVGALGLLRDRSVASGEIGQ